MDFKLMLCVCLMHVAASGLREQQRCKKSKEVTVKTEVGKIKGKLETIEFDGNQYSVKVFLGIPYAEKPIGKLRFQKPRLRQKFKTPFSAMNYGPACLQRPDASGLIGTVIQMNEDCLYLNIFVPDICLASDAKLPVMIWFHGGGFNTGTSQYYPGEKLSAVGQVIIVTANYRLGHMGFLRTKEEFANFGLWDQRLALLWVQNNIESFDGDSGKITLFGESAGASAVVYQAMFRGNQGLFSRAIIQSGSITSPWAFATNDSADLAFQNFATEAGCTSGYHDDILECLRNKSPEDYAQLMTRTGLKFENVVPNLDSDFVPRHPQDMMRQGENIQPSLDNFHNIDLMLGGNRIDGALFLSNFAAASGVSVDNYTVPRVAYETAYIPWAISKVFMTPVPTAVQITKFMYTNCTHPYDDIARTFQLVDLIGDSAIFAPMVATARLHASKSKQSTYQYLFSTAPTIELFPIPFYMKSPVNANHADELVLLFGFPSNLWNVSPTAGDIVAAKRLMTMWSNFAKTGNPNQPSSLSVEWPEFTITSQQYLDITPIITSSSIKKDFKCKQMKFWMELIPELLKNET